MSKRIAFVVGHRDQNAFRTPSLSEAPMSEAAERLDPLGHENLVRPAAVDPMGKVTLVEAIVPVVLIGASAGGLQPLRTLIGGLSSELPAAVFVVVHTRPNHVSKLAEILSRSGPLPACVPADGERIAAGHIYVAPPDHHLTIAAGRIRVAKNSHEHFTRPAIDPLFRSAEKLGPQAIAVVLSGMGKNGAAGIKAIKDAGGTAIVQDPEEAMFPSMPNAAIAAAEPDFVSPVAAIGPLVNRLCSDMQKSARARLTRSEIG